MSADVLSKNLEVREAFVGDDPWDAVLVAGFWGIFARSLVWGFGFWGIFARSLVWGFEYRCTLQALQQLESLFYTFTYLDYFIPRGSTFSVFGVI